MAINLNTTPRGGVNPVGIIGGIVGPSRILTAKNSLFSGNFRQSGTAASVTGVELFKVGYEEIVKAYGMNITPTVLEGYLPWIRVFTDGSGAGFAATKKMTVQLSHRKAADGTITPLLRTTGTPALNTWGVDTATAKYVIDGTYDSPTFLAESLIDAANFPVLADGDQFLLTTVVDTTPGASNLNFEAGIVIPDANDLGLQSF